MKEKINYKMSGIAPPNSFLSSVECSSILSVVKIRYASLLLNFPLLSLGAVSREENQTEHAKEAE